MIANKNLLLLPGDGIGPEVMAEAKRVLNWLQEQKRGSFEITEDLVGGASIDAHGVPVTEATVARALAADAVLFGSVGGPKWDSVPFAIRPEAGLLRLRKDLGRFRQSAPREGVRRTRQIELAEARTRARPRHHDRARMHRRHLFRRSARH